MQHIFSMRFFHAPRCASMGTKCPKKEPRVGGAVGDVRGMRGDLGVSGFGFLRCIIAGAHARVTLALCACFQFIEAELAVLVGVQGIEAVRHA